MFKLNLGRHGHMIYRLTRKGRIKIEIRRRKKK
jgi:hypothetical protein